jgi:hypothetical protein
MKLVVLTVYRAVYFMNLVVLTVYRAVVLYEVWGDY